MNNAPRRALLVIDVQNDYAPGGRLPIEYPDVERSLANIGRAMDGAAAANLPVVVIETVLPADAPFMARGTSGAELHEVVRRRPYDHLISKRLPSSFADTELAAWLKARHIDTISVAGFMTHNCDDATIRQAVHLGLAVEFLADAAGSVGYANRAGRATAEEIHRAFIVVMQSRFAAVMSTDEWLAAVQGGAVPERDSIVGSYRKAHQTRANGL